MAFIYKVLITWLLMLIIRIRCIISTEYALQAPKHIQHETRDTATASRRGDTTTLLEAASIRRRDAGLLRRGYTRSIDLNWRYVSKMPRDGIRYW